MKWVTEGSCDHHLGSVSSCIRRDCTSYCLCSFILPSPFSPCWLIWSILIVANVLDSMWGHTWVNNTICWYFTCFLFGGTSFLQDGGQESILRHQIGWLLSVCLFTFLFYPFPPYTLSWYASITPGRTLCPLVSGSCSVNENRQNIWERSGSLFPGFPLQDHFWLSATFKS